MFDNRLLLFTEDFTFIISHTHAAIYEHLETKLGLPKKSRSKLPALTGPAHFHIFRICTFSLYALWASPWKAGCTGNAAVLGGIMPWHHVPNSILKSRVQYCQAFGLCNKRTADWWFWWPKTGQEAWQEKILKTSFLKGFF